MLFEHETFLKTMELGFYLPQFPEFSYSIKPNMYNHYGYDLLAQSMLFAIRVPAYFVFKTDVK